MVDLLSPRLARGLLVPIVAACWLGGCSATATNLPTATLAQATPTAPAQAATWLRGNFEPYWNIEYPADWALSQAAQPGNLFFQGDYNNQSYVASFTYPSLDLSALPGVTTATLTLEAWVDQELARFGSASAAQPVISDLTVAGAPAKKVLFGTAGWVYMGQHGATNPRVITVSQPGNALAASSPDLMALLDRLVAGVR